MKIIVEFSTGKRIELTRAEADELLRWNGSFGGIPQPYCQPTGTGQNVPPTYPSTCGYQGGDSTHLFIGGLS